MAAGISNQSATGDFALARYEGVNPQTAAMVLEALVAEVQALISGSVLLPEQGDALIIEAEPAILRM